MYELVNWRQKHSSTQKAKFHTEKGVQWYFSKGLDADPDLQLQET